jgi:hypothetical protein
MGAEIIGVRPADEHNQVVTIRGGSGQYRRRPCPGCPWVVANTGSFPAEAFAHSANTAEDMSGHMFGCHESGTGRPVTCAGFLLRGAEHNMAVRMRSATGQIDLDQVHEDGRELHPGYVSMAVANGLDPADLSLRNCRLSYGEEQAMEGSR